MLISSSPHTDLRLPLTSLAVGTSLKAITRSWRYRIAPPTYQTPEKS